MKAAVCYEFGQPLSVEEVEIDRPQAGEVKVRLVATAICHSDIHAIEGDWGGRLPVIAGHEAAGIVDQVGDGVTSVETGDHIVVSLLRSCGACQFCMSGSPHLCEGQFALNTESRLRSKNGQTIQQGIRTAAFAEYVVVHQSQVIEIPESMPLESAALLACGVITGYGAVVNTACVSPGQSVTVVGVGGVGINSVQGAALSGAYPVIAVDILEDKLNAALDFGATHTVKAGEEETIAQVKELTSGYGADYVFVTVGDSTAISEGFEMTSGKQGTMVIVGIPKSGTSVSFPMFPIVLGEKTVKGSFMGSSRLRVDIPRLVKLYQAGRYKLDELISNRYPLEAINEAIASTKKGNVLRNIIVF